MVSGADVVASTDVVASAEVSDELRTGAVEVDVVEIGVEVVDDTTAGLDVVVSEDTVAEVVGTAVTWDVDVNVDG